MYPLFNFVVRNRKWTSLESQGDIDPDGCPTLFQSNEDIWIALTYLRLKRRGIRISLSYCPVRGRINVVDGIHLTPEDTNPEMFLVGCRSDGHYPALCQIVLHQNTLTLPGQTSIYVPEWSQPGIICRDPDRLHVKRIGFFGHASVNLSAEFHDTGFAKELMSRGYELIINDMTGSDGLHDYSNIDLTLSIRNIPYAHLLLKPANKLINSWRAGAPAIIGPEPAIQALRRSSLDYFEARGSNEVLTVLRRLESDSSIYQRMVAHGRIRAQQYEDGVVTARWLRVMQSIYALYVRWTKLSAAQVDRSYIARVRSHSRALQRHERDVHRAYWKIGFERKWWESRRPPSAVGQRGID